MKRVEEKVKDIIEVRPFSSLHDFAADPAQTLTGYHFTDITSDLMAKWLDIVATVTPGHGAAAALAGFRGVGKSHFLAVLAAIVSRQDLRANITDHHVAAKADRLSRRHNAVAFVRRGSKETLLDELKAGLADFMNSEPRELGNSLNELLRNASERAGEMPLVLLIDTALGRDSRVSRDDGQLLSEIAAAAKSLGIFVGLALDDDIAGADGANSSITGSYSIDYLDQEHLYKIVGAHIFAKKEQALPILHNIYKYFSAVLPGFRWSEQRFVSLYPLHPSTIEIAPLIRLYLQDFAMLGFASQAGVRILGRPANSLIGLDEVFDAVEKKLRVLPDLEDAFSAFDEIDRDIISTTPVHLRLPAKLILKGLFMLSLDGQGSTAAGIAASMLIVNDGDSASSSIDVTGLLETFSSAKPDLITRTESSIAPKFCFKVASKDDLNVLLGEAARNLSEDVIPGILLRYASDRFSDLGSFDEGKTAASGCTVEWRNSVRHGEVVWNFNESKELSNKQSDSESPFDWRVVVSFAGPGNAAQTITSSAFPIIQWQLGTLTTDDIDTIRRLHVLQTDFALRELFGDGLSASIHIQALAVEKIWKRVFLEDASLVFEQKQFPFVDTTQSAHTLSQLLTMMLTPVFESEYPLHPEFAHPLGVIETANLTGQFFGGAAPRNGDVQKLAESYALPLGLVELDDNGFAPATAETLNELPVVQAALGGVEFDVDSVVTTAALSAKMLAAPYGLARDARHLVLASLVAQRLFEFVTFSGNRINHRSLDLQIIWDDIAGIAKPFAEAYSGGRLREWAVLLTDKSSIKSLDRPDDRLVIIDALSEWLSEWKQGRVLEMFETLPDEHLNSAIWKISANLRKTFGAVADSIEALNQNLLPLDQCIKNIADLFSDSKTEFEKKKHDLDVLRVFTVGAAKRDEIITYLSLCETTADPEVERLRQVLLELTGAGYFSAAAAARATINDVWDDFKAKYSALYVETHNATINSTGATEKLKEILSSDRWAAFESFADIGWFDANFASAAITVIRRVRQMECVADTSKLINTQPFCSCSFSLARFERRQDQPYRLDVIVNQGLSYLRMRLIENGKEVAEAVDAVASNRGSDTATSLKKWLTEPKDAEWFVQLSAPEIRLLRAAIERAIDRGETATPVLETHDEISELLPDEVRAWENELDQMEIFAETNA